MNLVIRDADETVKLILAGRNPQKGELLAKELSYAETAYIDLEEGFNLAQFREIDLIISALDDHSNILRETAILNSIACITVSELADQISTTAFLSLYKTISAPIVFAGHWQAGLLTLVVKQMASEFSRITHVETAGLYDKKDPVGPLVEEEVSGFLGKALIRKDGNWLYVDSKNNARLINIYGESSAIGHPMSALDVPSIAAFTDARNIRFDFIIGESIGSSKGLAASHDLYIEIEGISSSGEPKKSEPLCPVQKGILI